MVTLEQVSSIIEVAQAVYRRIDDVRQLKADGVEIKAKLKQMDTVLKESFNAVTRISRPVSNALLAIDMSIKRLKFLVDDAACKSAVALFFSAGELRHTIKDLMMEMHHHVGQLTAAASAQSLRDLQSLRDELQNVQLNVLRGQQQQVDEIRDLIKQGGATPDVLTQMLPAELLDTIHDPAAKQAIMLEFQQQREEYQQQKEQQEALFMEQLMSALSIMSEPPAAASNFLTPDNPNPNFLCPITGDVMTDPVITTSGSTYERHAITKWLTFHDTDPTTNLRLDSKQLIPNYFLKATIQEWRDRSHGQQPTSSASSAVQPTLVKPALPPPSGLPSPVQHMPPTKPPTAPLLLPPEAIHNWLDEMSCSQQPAPRLPTQPAPQLPACTWNTSKTQQQAAAQSQGLLPPLAKHFQGISPALADGMNRATAHAPAWPEPSPPSTKQPTAPPLPLPAASPFTQPTPPNSPSAAPAVTRAPVPSSTPANSVAPLITQEMIQHLKSADLQDILQPGLKKMVITKRITLPAAQAFATALASHSSLQKLQIGSDTCSDVMGSDVIQALAAALVTNTSLTTLTMMFSEIDSEGAAAVATALAINTSLLELQLGWSDIDSEGATALATALATNTSLQWLDLHVNDVGLAGAAALATGLAQNTGLESLNLNSNGVGSEGAAALAKALITNSSLRDLDLGSNDIGSEGAAALATALTTNSSLQNLDMAGNEVGSEGATALAKALATKARLRLLGLCQCDVGSKGARALATALITNTSLQELYLGVNNIGSEGATALAAALTTNTSLRVLDLAANKIGAEGAVALAKSLTQNATLQSLALFECNIGSEGATALAKALATNTSLKELNLDNNDIGSAAAQTLAKALATNTSLQQLNLSYNRIKDKGAAALAKALATNTSLQVLSLIESHIDLKGAELLFNARDKSISLKKLTVFKDVSGS